MSVATEKPEDSGMRDQDEPGKHGRWILGPHYSAGPGALEAVHVSTDQDTSYRKD